MAFNVLNKTSATVDVLVDRAKNDKVLLKEILRERNTTDLTKYAGELGISIIELVKLRATLKVYAENTRVVDFEMNVEKLPDRKDMGSKVMGRGNYKTSVNSVTQFFLNSIYCDNPEPGLVEMFAKTAISYSSLVDIKEGVASPVVVSAHTPSVFKPVVEEVRKMAAVIQHNKITSDLDATEFVKKEFYGDSNETLANLFATMAPKSFAGEVKKVSGKWLVIPRAYSLPNNPNVESAKLVCKAMSRGAVPSGSKMAKYCEEHIYGVSVPSDVRRYIDFLTDFVLPDGIDTVHLHTGDTKYAVGLYHMYPKLTIIMRGKVNMDPNPKSKIKIGFKTENTMMNEGGKKNVMGIFFEINRMSDDAKENPKEEFDSRCKALDEETKIKVGKYHTYFRYIFIFAVSEDDKLYKVSCGSRDLRAIECKPGGQFTGKEMYPLVGIVATHCLTYPYTMKPLIKYLSILPDLKDKYSLKMDKRMADELYANGFSKFLSGVEEYDKDFVTMIEIAKKKGSSSSIDGSIATFSVTVGKEEQEEDDDNEDERLIKKKKEEEVKELTVDDAANSFM